MTAWAAIAAAYDPIMRMAGWRTAQMDFAAGLRNVLDVGCGTAFLAQSVGPGYTGVDREIAMLRRAAGAPRLVAADARALPFGNDSFDVVVTTGFLGLLNVDDRALILTEIARVARYELRALEPIAGLTRGRALALSRYPVVLDEFRAAGFVPMVGPRTYHGLYASVRAVLPHTQRGPHPTWMGAS